MRTEHSKFALIRGLISVLLLVSRRYRAPSLRSGFQKELNPLHRQRHRIPAAQAQCCNATLAVAPDQFINQRH
jgi:hypothetical protein